MGWGVKACADSSDAGGWEVKNLGKLADVRLEHSLSIDLFPNPPIPGGSFPLSPSGHCCRLSQAVSVCLY